MQLLLLEEFKNCLPNEEKTYLDAPKFESLQQATTFIYDYTLIHWPFSTKVIKVYRRTNRGKAKPNSNGNTSSISSPSVSEAVDMESPHWTNPGKEIGYHLYLFVIIVCNCKGQIMPEC